MADLFFVLFLLLLFFGSICFLIFIITGIIKNAKNPPNILPFYHIDGIKGLNQNEILNLEILKDSINLYQKKENVLTNIPIELIESIKVLQEYENTEQNKSVIGRALVGGLLLGGVGAVIGGISGVGTKTRQNVQYYLEITANENILILKPFLNSKNIANVIKKQINNKIEGMQCQ